MVGCAVVDPLARAVSEVWWDPELRPSAPTVMSTRPAAVTHEE
jgi:hypothetical protein